MITTSKFSDYKDPINLEWWQESLLINKLSWKISFKDIPIISEDKYNLELKSFICKYFTSNDMISKNYYLIKFNINPLKLTKLNCHKLKRKYNLIEQYKTGNLLIDFSVNKYANPTETFVNDVAKLLELKEELESGLIVASNKHGLNKNINAEIFDTSKLGYVGISNIEKLNSFVNAGDKVILIAGGYDFGRVFAIEYNYSFIS